MIIKGVRDKILKFQIRIKNPFKFNTTNLQIHRNKNKNVIIVFTSQQTNYLLISNATIDSAKIVLNNESFLKDKSVQLMDVIKRSMIFYFNKGCNQRMIKIKIKRLFKHKINSQQNVVNVAMKLLYPIYIEIKIVNISLVFPALCCIIKNWNRITQMVIFLHVHYVKLNMELILKNFMINNNLNWLKKR